MEYFKGSYDTDDSGNLLFRYGAGAERFGPGFHIVPVFGGYWCWGEENPKLVKRIVICSSAMEAICWLHYQFPVLEQVDGLFFLATGLLADASVYERIHESFKTSKISLVLGNDLLGRICDIKMAVRLSGRECKIWLGMPGQVVIVYRKKEYIFLEDKLSLSAFEVACGLRSGIRTFKAKRYGSFFLQFINANR